MKQIKNNKHRCIFWANAIPFEKDGSSKKFEQELGIYGIDVCFPQLELSVDDIDGFYRVQSFPNCLVCYSKKLNQYIEVSVNGDDDKNVILNPQNLHSHRSNNFFCKTGFTEIDTDSLRKYYSQPLSTIQEWKLVIGHWYKFTYKQLNELNYYTFITIGKHPHKVYNNINTSRYDKVCSYKHKSEKISCLKMIDRYQVAPIYKSQLLTLIDDVNSITKKQRYDINNFDKKYDNQLEIFYYINKYAHIVRGDGSISKATHYHELEKGYNV